MNNDGHIDQICEFMHTLHVLLYCDSATKCSGISTAGVSFHLTARCLRLCRLFFLMTKNAQSEVQYPVQGYLVSTERHFLPTQHIFCPAGGRGGGGPHLLLLCQEPCSGTLPGTFHLLHPSRPLFLLCLETSALSTLSTGFHTRKYMHCRDTERKQSGDQNIYVLIWRLQSKFSFVVASP